MSATFKGEQTTLQKRQQKRSADGQIDETAIYQGELTALQALGYLEGNGYTAIDGSSLTIQDVEYETAAAGPYTKLTVRASNMLNGSGGGSDTQYEIEWQRIEKDIKTHRAFQTGGAYPLDATDLDEIAAWERTSDREQRETYYTDMSAEAKQCADRIARGQSSYPIWVPVARKTSHRIPQPTVSAVGSIQTPPTQCRAPANTALGKPYTYVLVEDSATKTPGRPWRRTQTWMGFDEVDTLIYQNQ